MREKILARIFRAAPVGFGLTDLEVIREANSALCAMTGYPREELLGIECHRLYPTREAFEQFLAQLTPRLRETGTGTLETRWRCRDGRLIEVLLTAACLAPGDRTGGVSIVAHDITEHKRSEEAARASEAQLRFLIENTHDMISRHLPDGEMIYVNPACLLLTGYTSEELRHRRVAEIIHPGDLPGLRRTIAEATSAKRDTYRYEHRLRMKDGEYTWIETMGSLLYRPDGDLCEIQVISRDISQRKDREERRTLYGKLISDLINQGVWFEAVPLEGLQRITAMSAGVLGTERTSIWFYSEDYSRIVCHDLYHLSTGEHSQGETLDLSHQDAYTASHRQGQVIAASDVRRDARTATLPGDYYRQSGVTALLDAPVWVHGRLAGIFSFEHTSGPRTWLPEEEHLSQTLAAYVALCLEASERARAEACLRERQARLDSVLRAAPVGICVAMDRVLQEVNAPFCEMTGYSAEELIGHDTRLLYATQQDYDTVGVFQHRIATTRSAETETRFQRKDGRIIDVLLSAAAIDPADLSQGIAYIVLDMTERKQAEALLVQALKMESIGRLAGGVAHDLNNLLTPILGYAGMLKKELLPNDQRHAKLRHIEKAAESARDLTRQLLAFSRKQVLKMQTVDLNAVLTEFAKILRRTIREDVEIRILTEAEACLVHADVGQIEQIIMNLVVNAQDAMPDGGTLVIRTQAEEVDVSSAEMRPDIRPGPYIVLEVLDSGCGMDAATQSHIFEPFFTTKGGGQGTGLGLATVYGIVKQHGGSIHVYSEQGCGTSFRIYLPHVTRPEAHAAKPAAAGEILRGLETVAVAEDNAMVRNLATDILRQCGYSVISAENASALLEALSQAPAAVDLLLTDVIMPDMNGRELYTRLAAIFPGLRVIYMSGYTENVIARHGVIEEGIDFILKPFTIQGLSQKVRKVLDRDPAGR